MYIKGFDKDLKCRGFQFEVGGVYDTGYTEELELCSETVFHFCYSLEKVHEYYSCSNEENRYCEIEVLGELIYDENKCGSNKIKILREITGEELEILKGHINGNTGLFNIGMNNSGNLNSGDWNSGYRNSGNANSGNFNSGNLNSGDWNSGYRNSGDANSGNFNSGDWNSGYRNSGNENSGNANSGNGNSGDANSGYENSGNGNSGNGNSGDANSGYRNSGDANSGNFNSGNANSGNFNSGNFNSGDWNKCNGSNGIFCTEEQTIKIFDKDTNMTLSEFRKSKYNKALCSVELKLTEWIFYTEEEMEEYDDKKATKGYLKNYTYKEACANWWSKLTEENKEIIKSIPNFDADKFEKITGIHIE